MKKILYLSHIDWNWIKQRPQFIVEELSKNNSVICVTPHWYNRKKLQYRENDNKNNIEFIEFYGVPKAKKYIWIRKWNNRARSILAHRICKKSLPDVIYIAHPELYNHWMKSYNGVIVYDCMDDHCALTDDHTVKVLIQEKEKQLIAAANIILVTSESLRILLRKKYKADERKIFSVRNGFSGKIIDVQDKLLSVNCSGAFHIGYIGTVSSWFDLTSIIEILNKDDQIIIHIIGPIQPDISIPNHKQIIVEGIVEHDRLYEKISLYDALIMPFKVNDIVKSVDPVKLYEYINFFKPIISCYYDEIERFEPYVWFYGEAKGSLQEAVNKARTVGCKYSNKERLEMLHVSNWESRADTIDKIIDSYRNSRGYL